MFHDHYTFENQKSLESFICLATFFYASKHNIINAVLSYCFVFNAAGSINISNILTGKCLAKINASNGSPKVDSLQKRSTVAEALEDITALFYDEERNEIYTGTRQGLIHVWSN